LGKSESKSVYIQINLKSFHQVATEYFKNLLNGIFYYPLACLPETLSPTLQTTGESYIPNFLQKGL